MDRHIHDNRDQLVQKALSSYKNGEEIPEEFIDLVRSVIEGLKGKERDQKVLDFERILERGRTIQYWFRNEIVQENLSLMERCNLEAAAAGTSDFIEAVEMGSRQLKRKIVAAEDVLKLVSPAQRKHQLA